MKFFNRDIGRRQFISVSSTVIGAGMLAKPSRLLFAADRPSKASDNTKYGKYILSGYNADDPMDLGAEAHLYLGKRGEDMERHVFNQSTVVYIPPDMEHGPWEIKNIRKPFNFLQVVMGAEAPIRI